MDEQFTAWISKYALTVGILEKIVSRSSVASDMVVHRGGRIGSIEHYHKEGRDWHLNRDGAVARAEQMRRDKIASLQKQIARLEKLQFDEGTS